MKLLAPGAGGRFVQNDPTIGCSYHPQRGYGFRLQFDWEDVPEADRYAVRLWKTGAQHAAVNHSVFESQFEDSWCNAFVIDRNLDDWVWKVAAITGLGDSTTVADTLWSEERIYGFLPCRHESGAPCTAPPDTIPPAE